MSLDIEKVTDLADPNRCQSVAKNGQCLNLAVPGGTVCMSHGGNKQLHNIETASIRNYQLGKWQSKLNKFSDSPVLKSLRDEIAILRIMLEERLNRCADDVDLILQSGPISDMILKIDKVVNSCHKLESNMGQHLDKQQLLSFANRVVTIIGNNITDEELLDKIANEIIAALSIDEQ